MLRGPESFLFLPNGGRDGGFPSQDADPDKRLQVERWRNAETQVIRYPGGTYQNYKYRPGWRLLIDKNEVMDTCETPWSKATVNEAFNLVHEQKRTGPYIVFERGYGLGIAARQTLRHLNLHGGRYDVVELNRNVVRMTKDWAKREGESHRSLWALLGASEPKVEIRVYEGDAVAATQKRAQKIAEGRDQPADIIISDTYPLDPQEQGINDLKDLETLKKCLSPHGVFAFYAYFPGSEGGIVRTQRDIIAEHFSDYRYFEVPVNPPPSYRYLQSPAGPVRSLPVVICRYPKF